MIVDIVDLYKYFGVERPKNGQGYLKVYAMLNSNEFCPKRLRPAMLIIPGGGYAMVSDREKEAVAIKFLSKGYNAFTLEYSVAPVHFPYQLLEGCMAMAYIRENANKFNIDAEHVGAIGFSAGGHLCGMLATIYDDEIVLKTLKNRAKLCRPDAVILSYPVITSKSFTHFDTMENISGGDEKLKEKLSIENCVKQSSSPAFIWCTADDNVVPAKNSFVIAEAYAEKLVPYELHVFTKGVHGLSIATKETDYNDRPEIPMDNPPVSKWFNLAITWLTNRGFDLKIG